MAGIMNSIPTLKRAGPHILMVLGAAIALAAYMQAINYPFVSDDYQYIVNNEKLKGLAPGELWRLFSEPFNPFEFLPLRDLSLWLDIKLFGLSPLAFRVHNFVLYFLSLPLVYGVTGAVWRYFRPADTSGAGWGAAVVTALYAIHPAHVEAAIWATGRKDQLACLFALLAMWFAVRARREHGLSIPGAFLALLSVAAMMLSKASYVPVAAIIAMLWIAFWLDIPAQARRKAQLLWPLAVLVLVGFITRYFVSSNTIREAAAFDGDMAVRAVAVLGRLVRIALSLEDHHFFYPVMDAPYLTPLLILGGVVLAVATAGAGLFLRKRSLAGFSCVAFLLLCIPYMHFVPFKTFTLVQDRYVSLAVWPLISLTVILAWRMKFALRISVLLALGLWWAGETVERPGDWKNYDVLNETDVMAYPGFYAPSILKIFNSLMPNGMYDEARKVAGAIEHPGMRSIVVELVESAIAAVDASSTRDPYPAMARLQALGKVLEQKPAWIKPDPSKDFFWDYFQNIYGQEWQFLTRSFPSDEVVYANSRNSLRGLLKYGAHPAH